MALRSDPRRLPRRNHYQEGPGFLFVATQGGRPPDTSTRPGEAMVVRRRRRALRRWGDGESIESICREAGCSRATLFRWRARFAVDGIDGLRDRYRAGGRIELPAVIGQLILTVRLLTYWNSRRLAAEFRRRDIWPLSHAQVDRLLGRTGTNRPSVARVPGPRYERARPNELWHIDLKGPFYLQGARGALRSCHFIALVDAGVRTNVEGIWAIGDVNGEQPFTRVCQEAAKVAFADAFGAGHPGLDRRPLGHAIFTDPEIGSVGLTEAQARAQGLDVLAGTVGFDQVEKAELIGERNGVIKVVVERGSRRLLGLHIAGPAAADLVYDGALILRRRGTVDEIASTTGIFPTLQEGVEGTARAVLRSHGVAGPAASLSAHHEGGSLACPACAAEYELEPKDEAAQVSVGSFVCASCAAEYDITTTPSDSPVRLLGAPADSFACPSCAAELEAVVT